MQNVDVRLNGDVKKERRILNFPMTRESLTEKEIEKGGECERERRN